MSERRRAIVHCPLDAQYKRQVDLFSQSLLSIPTDEHPLGQAGGRAAEVLPKGEKTKDDYSLVLVVKCEAPTEADLDDPALQRAAFKEAHRVITEMLDEAERQEEEAVQRVMRQSYALALAEFW